MTLSKPNSIEVPAKRNIITAMANPKSKAVSATTSVRATPTFDSKATPTSIINVIITMLIIAKAIESSFEQKDRKA